MVIDISRSESSDKPAVVTVDWAKIAHFKPTDNWGNIERVNPALIYALEAFRKFVNCPIILNNAYRAGDKGEHGKGNAADIVVAGLHVVDQFLAAEKSGLFCGIGIYPYWNRPGIHVDLGGRGRRWARNSKKEYVALSWQFMRGLRA